jgi:hypothetical protein
VRVRRRESSCADRHSPQSDPSSRLGSKNGFSRRKTDQIPMNADLRRVASLLDTPLLSSLSQRPGIAL